MAWSNRNCFLTIRIVKLDDLFKETLKKANDRLWSANNQIEICCESQRDSVATLGRTSTHLASDQTIMKIRPRIQEWQSFRKECKASPCSHRVLIGRE